MELATIILTSIIAPSVAAWIAYVAGKRQAEATAKSTELENFELYVKANRVMMQDLKEKVIELTNINKALRQEIQEIKGSLCSDCPKKRK